MRHILHISTFILRNGIALISSAFLGLIMGLAKELSGGLLLPIGIHAGNNIAAWANNIEHAWSRV